MLPFICLKTLNIRGKYATVTINSEGHATASLRMHEGGRFFCNYAGLSRASADDQKKWLQQTFRFPNYTISHLRISDDVYANPTTWIEMDIHMRSYGSASGERLTIPVSHLITGAPAPVRMRNRTQSFELLYERRVTDTLSLEIPARFVAESLLTDVIIESEFGRYSRKVHMDGTKVMYVRRLETFSGMFEPAKYNDYFNFWQSIARADNQGLVFKRE
jgi:hypothetical protein